MITSGRRGWLALVAGLMGLSAGAAEPTGFRGDGAGLYPKATPPLAWSTNQNVAWKTALPKGSNASPLLVGNRIFVCAEPATLLCVAADTGKLLWQDTVKDLPEPPPKTHATNGYTSSTPCSDGHRIWVVFGQGVVACWDLDGKALWSVHLENPPHNWGGCISPRLAGGRIVVQFDHCFGLDPATGAAQWKLKTPWGWGSPVVARIGEADILYTAKGTAIEAATGKECFTGLIPLAYNSPALVDGVLYYLQGKPQAYALPATATEAPRPLWSNVAIAENRYYATPLVHDGLVYAIHQAANLSVLDRNTGALVYERRLDFLKGTVYPSPTLAGDTIHLSSENGQTVVIQPGREYRELARNSLEPFRACPVFDGPRMWIRGQTHLWCIGK